MSEYPQVKDLPETWKRTTLGNIRKSYTGSVNPDKHQESLFEYYSIPNFDKGTPSIEKGKDIGSTKKLLESEMVLLSKINPRINRVWKVAGKSHHQKIGSTEWIRFPRNEKVDPDYLRLYMMQSSFVNYLAMNASGAGGSLMRIKKSVVDKYPFLLPPFPEQRRIVAKIEELFSNLDAGVGELSVAEQQLERYRLSVLQAAVEGRLTADWRRTHDPEPADQLLERILKERKEKWYKSQYKDPVDPEFGSEFPEPPERWTVTSFDTVLSHVTSGPRGWSDYYHEGDGVFILAQNVRPGRLDLSETKNVNPPNDASGRNRAMVQKDDLLVTIVGANTGDVCHVDHTLDEHWVCQSVALMRPVLPVMSSYLEVYLNSQTGQRQYGRFAYGQGRPHLNFGQLKATPLLLPPLAEQKQIVAEVERLLSVADDASATTKQEQTRAERLRKSILKQAFSGKLVPHEARHSTPEASPESAVREGGQIEMGL